MTIERWIRRPKVPEERTEWEQRQTWKQVDIPPEDMFQGKIEAELKHSSNLKKDRKERLEHEHRIYMNSRTRWEEL
jgi:hypothetical protein